MVSEAQALRNDPTRTIFMPPRSRPHRFRERNQQLFDQSIHFTPFRKYVLSRI
jgi:hypothetical protein